MENGAFARQRLLPGKCPVTILSLGNHVGRKAHRMFCLVFPVLSFVVGHPQVAV